MTFGRGALVVGSADVEGGVMRRRGAQPPSPVPPREGRS
jgi:hypothetical protein